MARGDGRLETSSLLAFWGKARPAPSAAHAWHPLIYHCLDVAAVGEELLSQRPEIVEFVASRLGWSGAGFRRLFTFLLSLHDIGKVSRPFQAKADWWPTEAFGPRPLSVPTDPGHVTTGAWLLREELGDELACLLPALKRSQLDELLAPFIGHHGRPAAYPELSPTEMFGKAGLSAAHRFLALMREIFEPEAVPCPQRAALCAATWKLAGLAVLADWIGSRQAWFPYYPPTLSPTAYLARVARPQAIEALRESGIAPARASRRAGYQALTAESHEPSPVQAWAERVALPLGPFVAFIEDVTGGGKTEAALILAHRLLAERRAKGLYVALPTMATANAMYDRVAASYRRLFAENETPSLVLAHGRSGLHGEFRDSLLRLPECERAGESEEQAQVDASGAACAAWLADDRRKVFLADVGVGTIDQGILAVVPTKYQSLRLLGLAERVLIVDEAHAYDAYMGRELESLLAFQAVGGGSAIVLSATLPQTVRRKLASAFAQGLGQPTPKLASGGYPLVTTVAAAGKIETAMAARADVRRSFAVERLASARDAIDRIAIAKRSGAAVAWVRNTVDDALDAAAELRALGIEADLFHARFAMGDRLEIEREIVGRFGKQEHRRRPGVLVATQVIEQSLDLDFDLMVSDLAPIDLLLQRAGRLWRHPERTREGLRALAGARLLVVSPDPVGSAPADWFKAAFPRAAYVYRNHALLWLSARALFGRPEVRVPEDVRELVETVYGEDAQGRFPGALERNWIDADGEERAARSYATANLLQVEKGYGADHPGWDADTRTPTRLGDETTTLRLARTDGGRIVPWCDDPDPYRAWALSEVAVRATRVRGVAERSEHRDAAIEARRAWTRFDDDKMLLHLVPANQQGWHATVLDARNVPLDVTYCRRLGLRFV